MENTTRFSNAIVAVFAVVVFALFFSLSSISEEAHAYTNDDSGITYGERKWAVTPDFADFEVFTQSIEDSSGTTLESFTAQWQNGQRDIVVEPPYAIPNSNNVLATLTISYSLSGKNDYEPGDINLTIPYRVFYNMDKNGWFGYTDIPMAAYPSLSDNSDYSYVINEDKNTLTIINTKTVGAASKPVFDIAYQCGTHAYEGTTGGSVFSTEIAGDYIVEYSNDKFLFAPALSIENEIKTKTQEMSVRLDTGIELSRNAYTYREDDYATYPTELGTEAKPDNENEYVYTLIRISQS